MAAGGCPCSPHLANAGVKCLQQAVQGVSHISKTGYIQKSIVIFSQPMCAFEWIREVDRALESSFGLHLPQLENPPFAQPELAREDQRSFAFPMLLVASGMSYREQFCGSLLGNLV